MKTFILVMAVLFSTNTFAAEKAGTADWVVETGNMLIGGVAAKDLYNSLDASETLDPLSSNFDQFRTKQNDFAKCSASFYRVDTADGDVDWVIQDNAKCIITAPAGTTIKE